MRISGINAIGDDTVSVVDQSDPAYFCPSGQHFDYDINECVPDVVVPVTPVSTVYPVNPQTGMPIIPPPAGYVPPANPGSPVVSSGLVKYCQPGQVLNSDGSKCEAPFPWWLVGAGLVTVMLVAKKGRR